MTRYLIIAAVVYLLAVMAIGVAVMAAGDHA